MKFKKLKQGTINEIEKKYGERWEKLFVNIKPWMDIELLEK